MVYVEIRRKEFGGEAAVRDHMAGPLWVPPRACSQLGTRGARGPGSFAKRFDQILPLPLWSPDHLFLCETQAEKSPSEVRKRKTSQLGRDLGFSGKGW